MNNFVPSVFNAIGNVFALSTILSLSACGDPDLSRSEALKLLQAMPPSSSVEELSVPGSVLTVPTNQLSRFELDLKVYLVLKDIPETKQSRDRVERFFQNKSDFEDWAKAKQLYRAGIIGPVFKSSRQNLLFGETQVRAQFETNKEVCIDFSQTDPTHNYSCIYQFENCRAREITGISGQGIDRSVEYVSDCTPTKVGAYLGHKEREVPKVAEFRLYDDGWRVSSEVITSVN